MIMKRALTIKMVGKEFKETFNLSELSYRLDGQKGQQDGIQRIIGEMP